RAPVSQISAGPLPVATEKLALVTPLAQRANDARAPRLGMPPVLFEDEGKLLPNELRPRHAPFARGPSEQAVVLRVEGYGRRPLFCECHRSNITAPTPVVNPPERAGHRSAGTPRSKKQDP